jgi:hypothetical protein
MQMPKENQSRQHSVGHHSPVTETSNHSATFYQPLISTKPFVFNRCALAVEVSCERTAQEVSQMRKRRSSGQCGQRK